MGIWTTIGIVLLALSSAAVISLYRIAKYGPLTHLVPYAFAGCGSVILILSKANDAVLASLILVAITVVIHTTVWFDMRKDRRQR